MRLALKCLGASRGRRTSRRRDARASPARVAGSPRGQLWQGPQMGRVPLRRRRAGLVNASVCSSTSRSALSAQLVRYGMLLALQSSPMVCAQHQVTVFMPSVERPGRLRARGPYPRSARGRARACVRARGAARRRPGGARGGPRDQPRAPRWTGPLPTLIRPGLCGCGLDLRLLVRGEQHVLDLPRDPVDRLGELGDRVKRPVLAPA